MPAKVILVALLLVIAASRTYPLYKQCDSRWANEQLGTSSNTICKAGCPMSSVSMALAGIGKNYNPSSLNAWLKGHGGYASGDLFVWGSVNSLGLSYVGKIANSAIGSNLDANNVVILNVDNGGHWVLATGYSGNRIFVNDPYYSTTAYDPSKIVAGNSRLYKVSGSFSSIIMDEYDVHSDKMMEGVERGYFST